MDQQLWIINKKPTGIVELLIEEHPKIDIDELTFWLDPWEYKGPKQIGDSEYLVFEANTINDGSTLNKYLFEVVHVFEHERPRVLTKHGSIESLDEFESFMKDILGIHSGRSIKKIVPIVIDENKEEIMKKQVNEMLERYHVVSVFLPHDNPKEGSFLLSKVIGYCKQVDVNKRKCYFIGLETKQNESELLEKVRPVLFEGEKLIGFEAILKEV